MTERPGYLIATIAPDGHLTIFSTHWTEDEARRMLGGLGRIIGHDHTAYLIVVPEGEGIVDEPQTRLEPKSANPALAAPSAPAPASAASAAPSEPPGKFVRAKSQAEFEAETIAMMNGEIAMPGHMQFRDADDPVTGGGAIS